MKYKIVGDNLPAVICDVDAGEAMRTESGGMAWMSPNMRMETNTGGGLGKALARSFAKEHRRCPTSSGNTRHSERRHRRNAARSQRESTRDTWRRCG